MMNPVMMYNQLTRLDEKLKPCAVLSMADNRITDVTIDVKQMFAKILACMDPPEVIDVEEVKDDGGQHQDEREA